MEKSKLSTELEKIKDNLTVSEKALEKETTNVESLIKLVEAESDKTAKATLKTTLDAAEKKVKDLKSHIALGEKLVKQKTERMKDIDDVASKASPSVASAAADIKSEVKASEDAKESKKDAPKVSKPIEEKSNDDIKNEAEDAQKDMAQAIADAKKAANSAEKLKPQIEEADKQVARLVKLIDAAKEGSEQEKTLKSLKKSAEDDLKELRVKLGELTQKQSEAESATVAKADAIAQAQDDMKKKIKDDAEVEKNKLVAAGKIDKKVEVHKAELGADLIVDYQKTMLDKSEKFKEKHASAVEELTKKIVAKKLKEKQEKEKAKAEGDKVAKEVLKAKAEGESTKDSKDEGKADDGKDDSKTEKGADVKEDATSDKKDDSKDKKEDVATDKNEKIDDKAADKKKATDK